MFNKKGDGGITAIIIILIVLIFLGWLVDIGRRECSSNKECGEDYYCGSDFKCHQYPTIQKTITQVDYTRPALIIGAAIIITALILKYFNFKGRKEKKTEAEEEKELKKTKTTEKVVAVETKEKKSLEAKKEKGYGKKDYDVYYNYPLYPGYSQQYSVKSVKSEEKKEVLNKLFFFNNYVGMILSGLIALGIILATSLDYIGVAMFGAIILYIAIYKLWGYCIEYNLEMYLVSILSLTYILLSFIYFLKSGLFTLIGAGFLVITLFVVKETVSWVSYKKL